MTLRDVLQCPDQPGGLTVVVEDHLALCMEEPNRTIGTRDSVIDSTWPALLTSGFQSLFENAAIIGMGALQEIIVASAETLGHETIDTIDLVGPIDAVVGQDPFPAPQLGYVLGLR